MTSGWRVVHEFEDGPPATEVSAAAGGDAAQAVAVGRIGAEGAREVDRGVAAAQRVVLRQPGLHRVERGRQLGDIDEQEAAAPGDVGGGLGVDRVHLRGRQLGGARQAQDVDQVHVLQCIQAGFRRQIAGDRRGAHRHRAVTAAGQGVLLHVGGAGQTQRGQRRRHRAADSQRRRRVEGRAAAPGTEQQVEGRGHRAAADQLDGGAGDQRTFCVVGRTGRHQRVALRHGIDLSPHIARQLTTDITRWADLILVMERHHLEYATRLDPSARGKIFLLGHWDKAEVPDPYRLAEENHQLAYDIMAHTAEQWIGKL